MSSVEIYLAKADSYFQVKDLKKAYESLKIAGELGHVYAALDFAYHQAATDAYAALTYLSCVPVKTHPTIKFHRLLIDRFYAAQKMNRAIINELYNLVSEGHAESLIVLLSWTQHNEKVFSYLKQQLFNAKPAIHDQLFSEYNHSATYHSEQVNLDLIIEAVESKQAKLSTARVDYLDNEKIVRVMPDALCPFECAYMKTRYSGLLQPSMVLNPIDGTPMRDDIRTSEVGVISYQWADWISREIEIKMARLSGTSTIHGEPLNILRYTRGQQYRSHYDGFSESQMTQPSILEDGGQRTHTILAYLNTLDEGATSFPKLNVEVMPKQGTLVCFNNVDENNQIETKSYHSGKPVISSEKWLLTKWVRSNCTHYGKLVFGSN
ncbi:proline hydroxylase [Alteromonas mediterranea]|uniref:prolyl hydroxylase family protein n=1 Tax=Alteromonas mediterranea TaxID=314275 RepID=UPI0009037F3D|nr:2OG-Fe(II) oxygenase [Alteromonas mediterranea]APD93420.1 proline hydroxylase [Alteromonas mediterranea]APD97044.1 proline hydroxylase [Alteromonas mediterranea]QGX61115.1 proline hydroxylase [Alteromonas mediterranea]